MPAATLFHTWSPKAVGASTCAAIWSLLRQPVPQAVGDDPPVPLTPPEHQPDMVRSPVCPTEHQQDGYDPPVAPPTKGVRFAGWPPGTRPQGEQDASEPPVALPPGEKDASEPPIALQEHVRDAGESPMALPEHVSGAAGEALVAWAAASPQHVSPLLAEPLLDVEGLFCETLSTQGLQKACRLWGEPVSAEIPIEFQENRVGQFVASGGQPDSVSSEIPTGFPGRSDGPPVASGGSSVAASSDGFPVDPSSDGFPVDRVWTGLSPLHSNAPVLDENVLDDFEGLAIWVERQKENHMKWRIILNNHMTREKELGGQICGMHLAPNFQHERADDGQMRTTIKMPCSFDRDDGIACGATAVSKDKASGIEQSSKRLFLSLLLCDAARNNPHSKMVLHDNAWKIPTSDIIKAVADQVVPHLANSPMPLTLPNRCQSTRSRGLYESPLDPGVRAVEVQTLLVEISVSCGWYRNTEGWVNPSNLPKLKRDGKTITPWMELARLLEPGKLLSFLRDRPDVFEVWCGLHLPKLLMYRCRTNPDDGETPRAARTQPPVAPVSTKQHVLPVAPSDVDVVQNPLASTVSEDPGDESRQEPPGALEFASWMGLGGSWSYQAALHWPSRATTDTSDWLRIVRAAGPGPARGLLPLCAGTCPPPPVCRPPALDYPDAPPPPPEQMTAGTKRQMSLKCVGPPSQPVFTGLCGKWWLPDKAAGVKSDSPPLTKSSTPPVFTPHMHRQLVAQACGPQDAAGGAQLQGKASCRCGQCEHSWFASGWTCPPPTGWTCPPVYERPPSAASGALPSSAAGGALLPR